MVIGSNPIVLITYCFATFVLDLWMNGRHNGRERVTFGVGFYFYFWKRKGEGRGCKRETNRCEG